MACSCKSGSSNKQVTSVKQVVKKPVTTSYSKPERMASTKPKRTLYRRPL